MSPLCLLLDQTPRQVVYVTARMVSSCNMGTTAQLPAQLRVIYHGYSVDNEAAAQ